MNKNNLKDAIYYYNFLSDIDILSPLLTLLQVQFQEFISEPALAAYQEIEKEMNSENEPD